MPDLYNCPTPCDEDCEINGWGCHEAHDIPSHHEHDPADCEGRMLAANLRCLIDAGLLVTFGAYPERSLVRLEKYYVKVAEREALTARIYHGVTPGDAVARARQSAEQESAPDAR